MVLCEAGDLGCATSSASSKLVHGGLRYLEQLEFRLVAEALREREVLLRAAPHLVHPMRFVMPHAQGLRPAWMIRAGLFLYDVLARRQTLAASERVDLTQPPFHNALKRGYQHGYAYSDCWVDDARLVIANALAAVENGATILPRTTCVSAVRQESSWRARLRNSRGEFEVSARALINATGPWVEAFLRGTLNMTSPYRVRLVQGSHIVVPRLYEGEHAYILQNDDRRVVFVYPYEKAYTLVGTTDRELTGPPARCRPTAQEVDYLCRAANRYFAAKIAAEDVRWRYCGVRALIDEGEANPAQASRDYSLYMDAGHGRAPVVSIYGGKITTYRRLAERVLKKLGTKLAGIGRAWTSAAPLPGGEIPGGDFRVFAEALAAERPRLAPELVRALTRRHGARAADVLAEAAVPEDLGEHFGADLYAREVDHFIAREWAMHGEDVLWRRTKAGLHLSPEQQARVVQYVAARASECVR